MDQSTEISPSVKCAMCGAFLPDEPNDEGYVVCSRCGTEWEAPDET